MRGSAEISLDVNEKWLLDTYNSHNDNDFFADYYNNLGENIFKLTDKSYEDKSAKTNPYVNNIQRKYTWDWEKDFDNEIIYDFPNELMNFFLSNKGDVIATLTDLYLDRDDKDIPAIKYCKFFIKDAELRLTIPNQADDGLSLAYINELGELIIDNNQY